MLLSGVSRANAEYVRLDVWDRVETYMICMTPCAQAKDHFISLS
jgi:hypothetical protein